MWAYRRNPAIVTNKNGAVLNRRRRNRTDYARTQAEHYGDTPPPNTECDGQYMVGSVPG